MISGRIILFYESEASYHHVITMVKNLDELLLLDSLPRFQRRQIL